MALPGCSAPLPVPMRRLALVTGAAWAQALTVGTPAAVPGGGPPFPDPRPLSGPAPAAMLGP